MIHFQSVSLIYLNLSEEMGERPRERSSTYLEIRLACVGKKRRLGTNDCLVDKKGRHAASENEIGIALRMILCTVLCPWEASN